MKRLFALVAVLALLLTLTTGVTASAAGNGRHCRRFTDGVRTCLSLGKTCAGSCRDRTHCPYVDENGDGVCDNCTGSAGHCPYADENGDKVCDLCGKHCPKGGVRSCPANNDCNVTGAGYGYGNGNCDGTGPVNNGNCDGTSTAAGGHHGGHHSSGHCGRS